MQRKKISEHLQCFEFQVQQYHSQKDPGDRKEILSKIKAFAELIKSEFESIGNRNSRDILALKEYFENLMSTLNEKEEESSPVNKASKKEAKQKIDENLLTQIEFDPDEERKRELDTLKEIKAIKQATIDITNATSVNLYDQEEKINEIDKNSEKTIRNAQIAAQELKEAAQISRKRRLKVVKWVTTGVGWLLGGVIGGVAAGVGAYKAEKALNSKHDKRLEEISKAE